MSGDDYLRIGVIGAGYWGPNLIRVFDQAAGAAVTAICDQNAKRLDALRPQYKTARFLADAGGIVDADDIDAVIVALPASKHYEFAKAVLLQGKHCFVEKPLALKSAECLELIEIAERQQRVLMVGHTFEYNVAVRRVKDEIDQGELGKVLQIISQRLNLGQVRQDVDAIWNLAPHDISIALYWLDGREPAWICAQGFCHLQGDVADMGTITMGFDDGAVVHIIVSWLSPDKIRKSFVIGTKKMVVYDDTSAERMVQIYDKGVDKIDGNGTPWSEHQGFGEFQFRLRSGDIVSPRIDVKEPLKLEAEHFLECIRGGATPISDGMSGYRVTRILEAAGESMAAGGVRIPFRIDAPA